MTFALVLLGVALVVTAAVVVSARVRHPENIDVTGRHTTDPGLADLSDGSDRPAGPGAEDPPSAVPNRRHVDPPPSAS